MPRRSVQRIEHATWGAIVVWVGVLMAWHEPDGAGLVGAGAILVVSGLMQTLLGDRSGWMILAGAIVILFGVDDLYELEDVPIGAFAVIAVGAWMIYQALRGPSHWRRVVNVERDRHDEGPVEP